MVTVINADNMPAVLAQLAERQDELAAQIEALTALQAVTQSAMKSERDKITLGLRHCVHP